MADDRLQQALDEDWRTEKKAGDTGSSNGGGGSSWTTVNGYETSEVVSALQKMIRRGQEAEALYWASELMASGEDYRMWRRLMVIAAEDIGLADPMAMQLVTACNSAARLSKEWNIPFLAIMYMCRAAKNREADDAAYLYEQKRKEGWKLPIPSIAVDQHTRRGKQRLYQMVNRGEFKGYMDAAVHAFYYDGGLLKGYQELEGGDRYRKGLMDHFDVEYATYELEECDKPRILSGSSVEDSQRQEVKRRIPKEVEYWQHDDGSYRIRSFTEEDVLYVIDPDLSTCSCPAFTQAGDANTLCKHVVALRMEMKK